MAKTFKKHLFFLLILGFSSLSYAGSKDEVDLKKESAALANYMNSFKSTEQLVEDFYNKGIFTQADKADIYSFLKSKKVSISNPLPKAAASENTIKWGQRKITFKPDGSYQTESGRILNLNSQISFPKKLETAWEAIADEKTYSFKFSLISSAHAASSNFSEEAAAFYAAIAVDKYRNPESADRNVVMKAGHSIGAVFWPLGLAQGLATKWLWPSENLTGGTVGCTKDGKYEAKVIDRATWMDAYNYWTSEEGKQNCKKESLSVKLCAFINANTRLYKTFVIKDEQIQISQSELSKIFSGAVPVCNSSNAVKVKSHIDAQARSMKIWVANSESQPINSHSHGVR